MLILDLTVFFITITTAFLMWENFQKKILNYYTLEILGDLMEGGQDHIQTILRSGTSIETFVTSLNKPATNKKKWMVLGGFLFKTGFNILISFISPKFSQNRGCNIQLKANGKEKQQVMCVLQKAYIQAQNLSQNLSN
jgi:hypothetical protein